MKNPLILLAVLLMYSISANCQGDQYYKVTTIQAAPGKLSQLITKLKPGPNSSHRLMRHSQGDQWDLWYMEPVDSPSDYFSEDQTTVSDQLVALSEDMFVTGPPAEEFYSRFDENGYYHIEMFVALPGMKKKLHEERVMENTYLRESGRPENMIFTNVFGSRWTSFTLGFYRDIKHYAESADISLEDENRAAMIAGFESASTIGFYLRSLIREHHDTLVSAVK